MIKTHTKQKYCVQKEEVEALLKKRQVQVTGSVSISVARLESDEIVVAAYRQQVLCLMLCLPTREQCVEWLQFIFLLILHIWSICSMSLTRSRQTTLKWIKKRLGLPRRRQQQPQQQHRQRVSVLSAFQKRVNCLLNPFYLTLLY